jgi:hypothetical protein
MLESCAFGTAEQRSSALQRFAEAGADEIATYGSTPDQNAGLLDLWQKVAA